MQYCVFDLETTYGTANGRVSPPFNPGFNIISAGFKFREKGYRDYYYPEIFKQGVKGKEAEVPNLSTCDLLVGHNIKFDLLWLWENPEIKKFIELGGKIWDTAYAEYLLSAQYFNLHGGSARGINLKAVAKRRKCSFQKLDIVEALWEDGVRTEDINQEVLLEYNKYDVLTTEEVFLQQYKEAEAKEMLHTIQGRHEGLLATTEMEYNGLCLDLKVARKQQAELETRIELLREELDNYLPPLPAGCDFKWSSWRNVSALIFGGDLTYTATVPVRDAQGELTYYNTTKKIVLCGEDGKPIKFKSGKNTGKIKTKNITVPDIERGHKTRQERCAFTLPRLTEPDSNWASSVKGYWSTGEEILRSLPAEDIPMLEDLLSLKTALKDLGTYYEKVSSTGKRTGMLTCIQEDGLIHGHLNHYVTSTTRLSSKSPNLQNLSGKGKSEVKRIFVSRFGAEGIICEVDFSQLEVLCKSLLANDTVRLDAILSGVDEHCEWLAFCEEKPYEDVVQLCKTDPEWKKKRQAVKSLTFGKTCRIKNPLTRGKSL